jgi:hypothetical protein
MLIVFGSMELGLWYRDNLTLSDGAADGAKWAAIQGPNLTPAGETADYTAIKIMRQAMASLPPEQIDRIVIFKASSSGFGSPMSQVPSACKTATSSISGCNIYVPLEAFRQVQDGNADYFKCLSAGQPACGWNPTLRSNGPDAFSIDYLGVYIKYKRHNLTGFFGASTTLEVAKVSRLEPGNLVG